MAWTSARARVLAVCIHLLVAFTAIRVAEGADSARTAPLDTTQAGAEPVQDRLNPFSALWDNSIVICTILRNEAVEDVREWLQYHR